jgi:hypothetical protein
MPFPELTKCRTTIARAAVLISLCAACHRASDPAVGTWKLNTEKSELSGIDQQTIVIAKRDGNFQITEKGTRNNGTPFSVKYSVPADGGIVKYLEGGTSQVSVQMRRLSADKADFVVMVDGKQVRTSHDVFSPDGKTLTVKVSGTRVHGPPLEEVAVYERQ